VQAQVRYCVNPTVSFSNVMNYAGWKGYLWGAVSTVTVGGLAAGAAFGLVRALEGAE
jgi:hypothetical protein